MSTTTTSTSAAISSSARCSPSSPDARGGGDAQAAQRVLHRIRVGLRLVHVLHGDQADAAEGIVHHQQLLDPVLVQQGAGLVRRDLGRRR